MENLDHVKELHTYRKMYELIIGSTVFILWTAVLCLYGVPEPDWDKMTEEERLELLSELLSQ
jgi:hypothetical protein